MMKQKEPICEKFLEEVKEVMRMEGYDQVINIDQ